MSKTAAFMGMGALRNLVSDSIAIDMGSAATIIYVRGSGVVIDQPSLVAVNNMSGEVVAVGLEARAMYGREARDITVVAPLLNGVEHANFFEQRATEYSKGASRGAWDGVDGVWSQFDRGAGR